VGGGTFVDGNVGFIDNVLRYRFGESSSTREIVAVAGAVGSVSEFAERKKGILRRRRSSLIALCFSLTWNLNYLVRTIRCREKRPDQLRKLSVNASGISLAGGKTSCIFDSMAFSLRKWAKGRDDILNEDVVARKCVV